MSKGDWGQAKHVLLELESLFSKNDTVLDVQDVMRMAAEIQQHCSQQALASKEIIKEMTNRIASKEKEIIAPSEDEHKTRVCVMLDEKLDIHTQIEDLRRAINDTRARTTQAALEQVETRQKLIKANDELSAQRDARAYALTLYLKVSNITWSHESDHSHILIGTLGSDSKQRLREFTIDTRTKSSFEIANQLWSMIED